MSARVVLVKPGDVLLIGNLAVDITAPEFAEAMTRFKKATGIARILAFEDALNFAAQHGTAEDGTA